VPASVESSGSCSFTCKLGIFQSKVDDIELHTFAARVRPTQCQGQYIETLGRGTMESGMEFRYEGNEQKGEPSYERFRVLKHFVPPQLT